MMLKTPPGWTLDPAFSVRAEAAVDHLRKQGFTGAPIGLVLGSGLGNVVDRLDTRAAAPFGEIPGFHSVSVAAHAGRVVQARAGETDVICLQGRLHAYEGICFADVIHPIAVLCGLGCEIIVLTNAAGGLKPDMHAGDLAILSGLIDLHWADSMRGILISDSAVPSDLAGRGRKVGRLFDRVLSDRMREVAAKNSIAVHSGTYASLWGPNYEPAVEIGMLRRLGAIAVGMSTGPEAVAARNFGTRVVGVSCITNISVEVGGGKVTHDEVIEVGAARREDLADLLIGSLPVLVAPSGSAKGAS